MHTWETQDLGNLGKVTMKNLLPCNAVTDVTTLVHAWMLRRG